MNDLGSQLRGVPGATFGPTIGTSEGMFEQISNFPRAHFELLEKFGAVSVFDGFFKLWGVNTTHSPNLVDWNDHHTWKFAWAGRADDFVCFGSTAWGDQYAYHKNSLGAGIDVPVFLLDAFTMEAELLFNTFKDFWEQDFLRNAREPYDSLVPSARADIGPLAPNDLLAFDPPLQLGGSDATSVSWICNARATMIGNGDLAIQLDTLPSEVILLGAEHYVDEHGRPRIRLVT